MGRREESERWERLRRVVDATVRAKLRGPLSRVIDVEGLIQEIIASIAEKGLPTYDPKRGSEEALVASIAKNRTLDAIRAELHRRGLFERNKDRIDPPAAAPGGASPPDALALANEMSRLLRACALESLGPMGQEMFPLLVSEGMQLLDMTDEELEARGYSREHVYRWRNKLRMQLQECWQKLFGRGENL